MRHTHRTHGVRTDHELLAFHVILIFNEKEPTPDEIEDWEYRFRGNQHWEKALREVSMMLEREVPGFKAEAHHCGGQLCDHDGKFEVTLVRKAQDESQEACRMKCPQCGGEDWATVDVCPSCLRKTTGPVTMRIHSCGTEDGYARAYREIEEARQSRKSRCVERCQHPADFCCDYEDGTVHCLECIAEKFWQLEDIMSGKYNVHTLAGAIQTIAHPEFFAVKYDPVDVARKALHGSSGVTHEDQR